MRASTALFRVPSNESHILRRSIPIFLCPALSRQGPHRQSSSFAATSQRRKPRSTSSQWHRRSTFWAGRSYSTAAAEIDASPQATTPIDTDAPAVKFSDDFVFLPLSCPGCGALTQTSEPTEAGFYATERHAVRTFIRRSKRRRYEEEEEEEEEEERLQLATPPKEAGQDSPSPGSMLKRSESEPAKASVKSLEEAQTPFCDRCHQLLHHHTGVSVIHPTVEAIHDTLLESPHKYNHVYHVLDAADFPMSLIPSVHRMLDLVRQRSQNRRSKIGRFRRGRKDEMSFVITRSDLLAPKKEQIDSLMPYLMEVLRDALGRTGKSVRLGNVRCVSAKRGWWTKQLKDDVWSRGGGGWMVGKVNVGKSRLFENIFPKGRTDVVTHGPQADIMRSASRHDETRLLGDELLREELTPTEEEPQADDQGAEFDTDSLLPPMQPERLYPAMPLVSSLPGTTASPIRLSYGNGRGELVDLPGLARGELEQYVQERHRRELVMRSRVKPVQESLKYGKSLLFGGGLVRITPLVPGHVLLACSFMPIRAHCTSNEKAVGIQTQERESGVPTIVLPGAGDKMRSAGVFELRWDVTKLRSGPLTRKAAVGLKVDRLPFRVFATDILIEGCGWVELAMQVRTRDFEQGRLSTRRSAASADSEQETPPKLTSSSAVDAPGAEASDEKAADAGDGIIESHYPAVEIFTPEGRFVGQRRPMNAYILATEFEGAKKEKHVRPRRSMKGAKKQMKTAKRAAASAAGQPAA